MKREKWIALSEEFPFLNDVDQECNTGKEVEVRISRIDTNFLMSIPIDESYQSSAGNSDSLDRLFFVCNGIIEEIELEPARDHSTGYAYDKAEQTEGQSYLSTLVQIDKEFDFLVHFHHSYCSYQNGYDEDVFNILKPSKHLSLNEEWKRAIADARNEVFRESDI
jgi:hypothetical protein